MYKISEWHNRYEVSLKGREAKEGDELRVGPLTYVRLKVYGHKQGTGFRRMQSIAKDKTMQVFGTFCKFLELAGNQDKDNRGQLLNEKDQPATIEDLAFILGVPKKQIETAVKVLTNEQVGWLINENANTNIIKGNSIQGKVTQGKGTEVAGKIRKPPHFNYTTNIFENIIDDDIKQWAEAFPAVDIRLEIKNAAIWCKDNPDKRKEKWGRFLSNWFRRTQEHGGTNGYRGPNTKRSSGTQATTDRSCGGNKDWEAEKKEGMAKYYANNPGEEAKDIAAAEAREKADNVAL